jgi:hypothetical protein
MIIKKLLIIIISYYISNYLIIDRKCYDINYFDIQKFKEEKFRCIRYIDNKHIKKNIKNNIADYISKYPYTKCIKYKNEYIDYIINKNKIMIYNMLINILFYINIIFW